MRVHRVQLEEWQASADAAGLSLSEVVRQAVPRELDRLEREAREDRPPATMESILARLDGLAR